MKTQDEVRQRLEVVDKQIRELAMSGETATKDRWDSLHIEDETLRWILEVPTEAKSE